jgi:hypothetical protein
MRGDEARVVAAFCQWLTAQGWSVQTEVKFVDVVAKRGDDELYCEAKGRTSDHGLDVDTLYGQLLRRMPPEKVGRARFGVVVPEEALRAALRVSRRVRQQLDIDVYAVALDGSVRVVDE